MTSHWVNDENAALLTDLYEINMLQAYQAEGMHDIAVFDLFARRLPPERNYFVACGLEDVLHYLETFRFQGRCLDYLESTGRFSRQFIDYLADLRFTGDVYAAPEGAVVFANEPLLEIVAPIAEAQIVETFVMNQIHVASVAASKAARVVSAARGRTVVDYGLRRTHGADAGLKTARAFYIAGIDATSNVLAGSIYGIPISGTMAHSYVQAHDSEYDAYKNFLQSSPTSTLLVDTYDTLEGVRHVIRLARELGPGFRAGGIRLDSGDLGTLAKESRRLLNEAGLPNLKIFASSSLDEYQIEKLLRARAPIDGFGVGTQMGVSADAPSLDLVYKLVEYAGSPRMKRSPGKQTLPGRKQVFRQMRDGVAVRDVVGRPDEQIAGTPMLKPRMIGGKRTVPDPPLTAIREYCKQQIRSLPDTFLRLTPAQNPYSVRISPQLDALTQMLEHQ
jgi:nicotinate phosphoribosyltransferase